MSAVVDLRSDEAVVERLRRGDADAFTALVDSVGPTMLRLVRAHVDDLAVAEEVVQDAWVSVLRSIDGFEGRSSLRTWICAIAINAARKRSQREGRSVPRSSLAESDDGDRYFAADHPRWASHWTTAVRDWRDIPEERLLSRETRDVLSAAVAELPLAQRIVFLLSDIEGWSGPEICTVLDLSGSNQRVTLHRARARLRARLESYLDRELGASHDH
jgi:RNA polymerase sigma-70 factor (ECF subfamily)